jgi:hypothetical protein
MPSPLSSALEHIKPEPEPDRVLFRDACAAAELMAEACVSIDATEVTVMVGSCSVTFLRHDRARVPPKNSYTVMA